MCFFGTIIQPLMTAMIKSSDSHSDSDSPQSPPSNSHTKSLNPEHKSPNYQPNIKTKHRNLKNENAMQRSSPTKCLSSSVSQSYLISNTPPVKENCSPPPPNYSSHIIPPNNLSPRHSQSHPLSSPPYFQTSSLPDDTNCDNSSNGSHIHNIWQSTKFYHPTPPSIKTNDIPLTSVNSIFDQSESPVKSYSSCRFLPE